MRERLFQIIQLSNYGDTASRIYDVFLTIIAIISITPIIADNAALAPEWRAFFNSLEIISVLILLGDYTLRWATHDYRLGIFKWTSFVRYPFSPLAIITLIAIAPTFSWVPRSFGYLRLLRFLVLFRNVRSFQVLVSVFKKRKRVLMTVLALSMLYLIAAAVIIESLEPQMFDNPLDALLFVSTIDSIMVGHPQSIPGMIFGAFSFICGISLIMMPVGILTSGFAEEIQNQEVGFGMQYSRSDIEKLRTGFVEGVHGIVESFRTRQNMRIYAAIMVVSFAISCTLTLLLDDLQIGTWLGFTGIAFAAYALEPIAGILVALATLSISAVVFGEIGQILTIGVGLVTVLCFGFILRRSRKITVRRIVMVVLVSIIAYPIMVYVSMLLTNDSIYGMYADTTTALYLMVHGFSAQASLLIACTIDLVFSFVVIIPVVFLLSKAFKKQLHLLNTWAAEQKEYRLANHMFMPPELAVMEYTTAGVFDMSSRVKSGYPENYGAASTSNSNGALPTTAAIWMQGDRVRVSLFDGTGGETNSTAILLDNAFDAESYLQIDELLTPELAAITAVLPSFMQSIEAEQAAPIRRYLSHLEQAYPNTTVRVMTESELLALAL